MRLADRAISAAALVVMGLAAVEGHIAFVRTYGCRRRIAMPRATSAPHHGRDGTTPSLNTAPSLATLWAASGLLAETMPGSRLSLFTSLAVSRRNTWSFLRVAGVTRCAVMEGDPDDPNTPRGKGYGGMVVGSIQVMDVYLKGRRVGFIQNLVVRDSCRRRGYGRALVAWAEQACAPSAKELVLVVDDGNMAANALVSGASPSTTHFIIYPPPPPHTHTHSTSGLGSSHAGPPPSSGAQQPMRSSKGGF